MDAILIVSSTSAVMGVLGDLLRLESVGRIVTAQTGAEARRAITEQDFDLILIDSPLPDEAGDDLSIVASEKTTAGIILMVDSSRAYDVSDVVEDFGVFTLPKPLSPEFFYQAVKLLSASRKRVMKLENENLKLQQKIEEIRIVDRAKLVLIQVLKMTEPQAQRYIEKQSMNLRQTRLATAENILRTYEQ